MRLGVIDVGSSTVHLLVVDAHPGGQSLPVTSHKRALRLSEHVTPDGLVDETGIAELTQFVGGYVRIAEDTDISELMSFVTSVIREAPNGQDVLDRVREHTGQELRVLTGEDAARVIFLAARRWFGWSSGRLFSIGIGGGSLELATGIDETLDSAVSLPLGAGRLTATCPAIRRHRRLCAACAPRCAPTSRTSPAASRSRALPIGWWVQARRSVPSRAGAVPRRRAKTPSCHAPWHAPTWPSSSRACPR